MSIIEKCKEFLKKSMGNFWKSQHIQKIIYTFKLTLLILLYLLESNFGQN